MRLTGLLSALTSLVLVSTTSAQDVVIIIEDASGIAAPTPQVPIEVPAPVVRAPAAPAVQTPTQPYATPRVGYGYQLRAPESVAAQVEQLRRERPGIGGPISMMAAGFVTTGVSAWMAALYSWLDDWDCYDDCGNNAGTIGFSVLATAAFTIAVSGVITLIRRVRQRRRINQQIRALEESLAPAPAW